MYKEEFNKTIYICANKKNGLSGLISYNSILHTYLTDEDLTLKEIAKNAEKFLLSKKVSDLTGSFIISSHSSSFRNANFLLEFINYDFNKFYDFFFFFTRFFGEFIDDFEDEDLEKITINKFTDIATIIELAKKSYNLSKDDLIKKQLFFKKFIEFIYNINDNPVLKEITIPQRFYIFFIQNQLPLEQLLRHYSVEGMFHFAYSFNEYPNVNINNTTEFVNFVKSIDPDGSKISNSQYLTTTDIFMFFYLTIYHLSLNDKLLMRKCKNCNKYFLTKKKNVIFCDNIFEDNKTCKEIGNQNIQKNKEASEPTYGKYRKIYSQKAMLVKRNPDIKSYKEDYDKWKIEAKKFMQDIKNGNKTYEEFDKWLNKNK